MCNPISWIESEGRIFIITDAEIKSEKGKELIKECGNSEDIWGHGFCRKYYDLGKAGVEHEINDFSELKLFPKEIKKFVENWNKNFGEMLELFVPDLSGLTSLPAGVVFPKTVGGYLDLNGLTSLPAGVVFPKTVGGYLDLNGLTSLPDGVVFPKTVGGPLDLNGLTSLPDGVVFPKICGSPFLNWLTSLPAGVVFPETVGVSLNLNGLTLKDRNAVRNNFGI